MADVTTSFEITRLSGTTMRFIVDDLTDIAGQPVTSGANITINLYDQNNVLITTGSVGQNADPDNDTYYADITLPTVTRTTPYTIQATGSKNGADYKDVGIVWVEPLS